MMRLIPFSGNAFEVNNASRILFTVTGVYSFYIKNKDSAIFKCFSKLTGKTVAKYFYIRKKL